MSGIAQTLRGMLEGSFRSLPVLIFGWALFVGSTTGSIGLLILALGHAVIAPLATWILHTLASLTGDFGKANFMVPASTTCNILPGSAVLPGDQVYSIPSYWLAHVAFFFGFLISNAVSVGNMPAAETAPADKVERRKSQAELVKYIAIGIFLLFLFVRMRIMKCETWPGLILGTIVFYFIGNGWFEFAKACSARDSDVFGIVQGMLPPSAMEEPPMTCVFTGK